MRSGVNAQFAKTHPGGVEDLIGNRRGTRDGRGLADAERRLIRFAASITRRCQGCPEGDDRVGAPSRLVTEWRSNEASSISARLATMTLQWILVTDAVGVDHQPGILAGNHPRHADVAVALLTATSAIQADHAAP